MERRPSRERGEPNNDGLGWLWKGIEAVGVASVAAVAIGAAFSSSRDEEEKKRTSSGSSSRQTRPHSSTSYHDNRYSSEEEEDEPSLTITVDATPSRGGGIIRFAGNDTTYFYSVDWTSTFSFPQEPDKFEMVNALIALEIVKQTFPKRYEQILLQTDCNIALKLNGLESEKLHNQLLSLIKDMMGSLLLGPIESNRKITHVSKDSCPEMKLADNLSRNNCDQFETNLKSASCSGLRTDLSRQASHVLSQVKEGVPKQFWQRNM